MPIIGTKNKVINDKIKIAGEILKSLFSSMEERIKMIINPKKTNDKCLKKKA
tara:strand:- start:559 stop:714 length:156 start_codon:yes stop_codon:yes gene_type:complete